MMERNLCTEIKRIREDAKKLRKIALDNEDYVESSYFEKEFENLINDDFIHLNPDNLIDIYFEYFMQKKLPQIKINKGEIFYRARIGYNTVPLADEGISKNFMIPYYKHDIEAPPPVLATGGRFNRDGTSYLYLSDDIKTCLAEVHLQVGQKCSVSKFQCLNDIELLDLTKFDNDMEMQAWIKILKQPIHTNISYKYNITRFLADVFKKINNMGIYFESIQSRGNNIVCFQPRFFEPIEYSSKIYTASKITYEVNVVKDSIDEYVEKDTRELNSYNENRETNLEKELEYIEKWIDYRKRKDESTVD